MQARRQPRPPTGRPGWQRQQLVRRVRERPPRPPGPAPARTSGPPPRCTLAPPTASNITAAKPTAANRAASAISAPPGRRDPQTVVTLEASRTARRTASGSPQPAGQVAPTSQSARAPSAFSRATPAGPPSARSRVRVHAQAGQELLASPGLGRVDQVARAPDRDIIAAERRRDLVRRRRTAGEPQQRPVVDLGLPDARRAPPAGPVRSPASTPASPRPADDHASGRSPPTAPRPRPPCQSSRPRRKSRDQRAMMAA